jgi:hypothetical protein
MTDLQLFLLVCAAIAIALWGFLRALAEKWLRKPDPHDRWRDLEGQEPVLSTAKHLPPRGGNMNWVTQILEQSKQVHAGIARETWPNGAQLRCKTCEHTEHASTQDCANYLATQWPTHCGQQMIIDGASPAH